VWKYKTQEYHVFDSTGPLNTIKAFIGHSLIMFSNNFLKAWGNLATAPHAF
jgi:hypothetical protein